jgi:hypothetical protein
MKELVAIRFIDSNGRVRSKEYIFLAGAEDINVGDVIDDPRYYPSMKVVCKKPYTQYSPHIPSSKLVTLCVIRKNGVEIDPIRSLEISLARAIKWYYFGCRELRALAAQLYSIEELGVQLYNVYYTMDGSVNLRVGFTGEDGIYIIAPWNPRYCLPTYAPLNSTKKIVVINT